MDLEQFIEGAAQSGRIDSKGSFTLGAEAAREKLLEYQSTPERYLLMIVSAGIALGAKAVDIRWDQFQFDLSFPGALLDGDRLPDGLGRVIRGEGDVALFDLVLGLHGALRAGGHRVSVLGADRENAYLLTLTSSGETFERRMKVRQGLFIKIERESMTAGKKLARFVGKLRGFAGMCGECRLIAAHCEYARVPVRINRVRVNRPIFLPETLCSANVGHLDIIQDSAPRKLTLMASGWSAALALRPGKIVWVIFGVSYPGPEDLGLSGIVYADGLGRDISSEQVVQDSAYQQLVLHLQECKSQMVIQALKDWTLAKTGEREFLVDELAELMQRDRVSVPTTLDILEDLHASAVDPEKKLALCHFWALEARLLGKLAVAAEVGKYGYRFCLLALNSEGASLETLQTCIEMIEFSGDQHLPYLEWLLLFCYQGILEGAPAMDPWLLKANAEVLKRHGSRLQPLAHSLLLGLQGARTLWHLERGLTHNATLHLAYTRKMLKAPSSWTEPETRGRLLELAGSLLQYALTCEEISKLELSELVTQSAPQKPPPPESLERDR